MISIDLYQLDRPHAVIVWMVETWGHPSDEGRWNIKDLQFIEFAKDSDATFILLKYNLRTSV